MLVSIKQRLQVSLKDIELEKKGNVKWYHILMTNKESWFCFRANFLALLPILTSIVCRYLTLTWGDIFITGIRFLLPQPLGMTIWVFTFDNWVTGLRSLKGCFLRFVSLLSLEGVGFSGLMKLQRKGKCSSCNIFLPPNLWASIITYTENSAYILLTVDKVCLS